MTLPNLGWISAWAVLLMERWPSPANNPGLVADCEALLAARDTLAGTGTLNWSASTPIANWDGVTVGGTPQRVIGLFPSEKGLTGTIPPELGI